MKISKNVNNKTWLVFISLFALRFFLHIIIFILEFQLWNHNTDTMILSNKNGKWLFENESWILPNEHNVGYIESTSFTPPEFVLTLETGKFFISV